MSKFEKMDPKFLKSVGNVEDKVQSLCDPEEIKKTYLNPTELDPDFMEFVNEEREENKDGITLAEEQPNENTITLLYVVSIVYHNIFSNDGTEQVTVKLIVTEIVHSDKQKSMRRILSPVVSSIPNLGSDFGMFHTALIIGPWYLEWTDSSTYCFV